MKKLSALAAIAVVIAAMFAKVFPFSGHLLAITLILPITRLQNPGWFHSWFRNTPLRQVVTGCVSCLLAIVGSDLILFKALPMLGLPGVDFSRFHGLRGDRVTTAEWIAAVWLLAAPSEEIISRGFLINQWSAVIGNSRPATAATVLISSLTFGLVHFYQGVTGVIMSVCAGLWFGCLYIRQQRSLWANIFAHGLIDTAAMLAFFRGWR